MLVDEGVVGAGAGVGAPSKFLFSSQYAQKIRVLTTDDDESAWKLDPQS